MTKRLFGTLEIYTDDAPRSAAMNMAIDEALFESAAAPSIRFYCWEPPALSFGYFGRFADVADKASERDLVRRWTGGGIVFHGEDLTYSIVIPACDPVSSESSLAIYEKVHRALCDALNANDERAVVAGSVDPGGSAVAMRAAVSSGGYSCFANPVRADVMIDGRKVAGAAQRRTSRGLLQQGSIQYVDLENGLSERLVGALSANCRTRRIEREILERAEKIAAHKYGTEDWLRKR
jgi:lipoyl(octanoyl) transferase